MTDVLRVVTFSTGGRPIETLNLNSAPGAVTAYFRDRDGGFQFVPAASSVQYSKRARRFGGGRAVGETHDNGSIGWTVYVRGTTLLAATQNVEALLQTISDEARGRYVEWAPEGGQSSFMEIAGPGTWNPVYNPVEFVQTNAMRVQLTFPIFPLVQWVKPTINDPFDVNSLADYTFDSATSADVTITAGTLLGVTGAALSVERRARHTIRGYDTLEGQASVALHLGGTLSGIKAGVLLRATSALNYIEVYIDDNGTNSRLRIDVIIAGARTNRATTNLAVRMATSGNHSVRGRIEGSVVTAEHFIGAPGSPMDTPANTTSYTLVGGDAPLNTTAGKSGWSWIPVQIASTLDNFDFRLSYRNLTWPRTVSPTDVIPGTAPAKCDVTITPSGGSTAPSFAMLGWSQRLQAVVTSTPVSVSPFGVIVVAGSAPTGTQANAAVVTNLSATADGGALSGTAQKDATVSGAETWAIAVSVDPTVYAVDDFSAQESQYEVWMHASIPSTMLTPNVVLSATSSEGSAFGAERFSAEWGSVGRLLTPGPGTFYSFYRLGTLTLPADPQYRRTMYIVVTLTSSSGSTGVLLIDYLVIAPVRQRCLSPTGKVLDSTYPTFVGSTAQTIKTIRSDLSALTMAGVPTNTPNAPVPDHGLGGSLIEPPPGLVEWFVKLSSQVPDNPSPPASAEQLTHAATIQLDYTPRSYLLRNT